MTSSTRRRSGTTAKRTFDVVVAGTGTVVFAPLMAVIAVLVRIDSRGRVLFRQERVGRGGKLFRIHKFRTMRDEPGGLLAATGDTRVTRVGIWLRRTKLDELPQLFDVLVGDMSLVGPRPEIPVFVEAWPAAAREIVLSVRPGITDPATILLRDEGDELAAAQNPEEHYRTVLMPRKVDLYVSYVRDRSLLGDVEILLRTVVAVVQSDA